MTVKLFRIKCCSFTVADFVGDKMRPAMPPTFFCVGDMSADIKTSATLSATKSASVNSTYDEYHIVTTVRRITVYQRHLKNLNRQLLKAQCCSSVVFSDTTCFCYLYFGQCCYASTNKNSHQLDLISSHTSPEPFKPRLKIIGIAILSITVRYGFQQVIN